MQTPRMNWMHFNTEELGQIQLCARATLMRSFSFRAPSPPSLKLAQVWSPDNKTKRCNCCRDNFSFSTRKHHCRFCGLIVCGECSANSTVVMGASRRTCDHCSTSRCLITSLKLNTSLINTFLRGESSTVFMISCQSRNYPTVNHSRFMCVHSNHVVISGAQPHSSIVKLRKSTTDSSLILQRYFVLRQVLGMSLDSASSQSTSSVQFARPFTSAPIDSDSYASSSDSSTTSIATHTTISVSGTHMTPLIFACLDEFGHYSDTHTMQCFTLVQSNLSRRAESMDAMIASLRELFVLTKTNVTWDLPDHLALLTRLWDGVYPDRQFPGHSSESWKEFGFQGKDPQTDFRGAGLLGLQALVYLVEHHSGIATYLLKSGPVREYPVCASALNILVVLFNALGIDVLRDSYKTPLVSESVLSCLMSESTLEPRAVFMDVFVSLLKLLDEVMVESGANYMQFQQVVLAIAENITRTMELQPLDLQAFISSMYSSTYFTPTE